MTIATDKPSEKSAMAKCDPILWGFLGAGIVGCIDKCVLEIGKKLSYAQVFEQQTLKRLQQIKQTRSPFIFNLTKFGLICVIPTIEEVFFRKLLRENQLNNKSLQDETKLDKAKRFGINSGIFALAHIQWRSALRSNALLGISMFSSGIIYNSLMDCGGILPPIIAHSLGNYLAIRSLFRKIH